MAPRRSGSARRPRPTTAPASARSRGGVSGAQERGSSPNGGATAASGPGGAVGREEDICVTITRSPRGAPSAFTPSSVRRATDGVEVRTTASHRHRPPRSTKSPKYGLERPPKRVQARRKAQTWYSTASICNDAWARLGSADRMLGEPGASASVRPARPAASPARTRPGAGATISLKPQRRLAPPWILGSSVAASARSVARMSTRTPPGVRSSTFASRLT